jgi:hypothetical protein
METSTVRVLAHRLSDDLLVLQGSLEVLAARLDLSSEARALTEAAIFAAERANEQLAAFHQAARVELVGRIPSVLLHEVEITEN